MPIIGSKIRPKILTAAITLFGTWGYQGVKTRAIARTAGCMEAGIYRLFKSKRGLYIEALAFVIEAVSKPMAEFALSLFQAKATKDPASIARHAVHTWYNLLNQGQAKFLLQVIQSDAKRRAEAESALESLINILTEKVKPSKSEIDPKRARTRAEQLAQQLFYFKCTYSGSPDFELREMNRYLEEWLRPHTSSK